MIVICTGSLCGHRSPVSGVARNWCNPTETSLQHPKCPHDGLEVSKCIAGAFHIRRMTGRPMLSARSFHRRNRMSNALVIDNHPGVRAAASAALMESMGFEEVRLATTATEALEELRTRQRPDLVMVDLDLGDLPGDAVVEEV